MSPVVRGLIQAAYNDFLVIPKRIRFRVSEKPLKMLFYNNIADLCVDGCVYDVICVGTCVCLYVCVRVFACVRILCVFLELFINSCDLENKITI